MDDRWAPGIGDPSAMGWVTVACYFVAAIACLRAALSKRKGRDRPKAKVWLLLALMLLGLGVNKQLDLQSLLTQVGRDVARGWGWYEQRRALQAGFVALVALAGLSGASFAVLQPRSPDHGERLAFGGTMLIFTYVLIRAASFHHVDWAINQSLLSVKVNWIIEVGGLALVILGAHRSRRFRII